MASIGRNPKCRESRHNLTCRDRTVLGLLGSASALSCTKTWWTTRGSVPHNGCMRIVKVIGREILDSRGNPTVEAVAPLGDGTIGRAAAPSGASTGEGEALELRDKDAKRYGGKGTHKAVGNIREKIAQAIIGIEAGDPRAVDNRRKALDPKPNKGELGANATVAVWMATARAAALSQGIPLYRYLGGEDAPLLPVPLMNILNGGEHANNSLDVQEFMIVPYGAARFSEALRMGTEVFHALKEMLHIFGYPTSVGDEGGFAPSLGSNEDALKVLIKAIEAAKYEPGKQIGIALDPAASTFYRNGKYVFTKSDKSEHTSKEMVDFWVEWVERYPAIISIEDGVAENDLDVLALLT